jgi:hypothetical protein
MLKRIASSEMVLALWLLSISMLNFKISPCSLAYTPKWNPSTLTMVKVVPEIIELGPENVTGKEFDIAVVVENVNNLWGFDINFSWPTEYLTYVNHTYTFPSENFSKPISPSPYCGILYVRSTNGIDNGTIMTLPGHGVKPTAGIVRAAVACLPPEAAPPQPSFNGSGTVFVLRLKVKYHPQEVITTIPLHLVSTDLAGKTPPGPITIPHEHQDGKVIIHSPSVHDLAITYIATSKNAVGQGYTMSVDVNVENQGNCIENFTLTLYANTTVVKTQTFYNLSSGKSIYISLTWITMGFAKGNYTISAYVGQVQGETDVDDNSLTAQGVVRVVMPGDADVDRDVDIYDVVMITSIYGSKKGDANYDSNVDWYDDGVINIYDVVVATSNYGQTDP